MNRVLVLEKLALLMPMRAVDPRRLAALRRGAAGKKMRAIAEDAQRMQPLSRGSAVYGHPATTHPELFGWSLPTAASAQGAVNRYRRRLHEVNRAEILKIISRKEADHIRGAVGNAERAGIAHSEPYSTEWIRQSVFPELRGSITGARGPWKWADQLPPKYDKNIEPHWLTPPELRARGARVRDPRQDLYLPTL